MGRNSSKRCGFALSQSPAPPTWDGVGVGLQSAEGTAITAHLRRCECVSVGEGEALQSRWFQQPYLDTAG